MANKINLSSTMRKATKSSATKKVFLLAVSSVMIWAITFLVPMTLLAQSGAHLTAGKAQVSPRPGVVGQRDGTKPRKDWSAAEVYVGPSYLQLDGKDLAGVQVGVTVNRWRHFSLVGTFGYHGGNQRTIRFDRPDHHPTGRCDDEPPHVSDHDRDHDNACPIPKPKTVFSSTGIGNVYTYLGGLRIRRNLAGRLAGFAQAQVGGVRVSRQNGLAVAAGGGLQLSLSQRFALEGRVEYLPLRLAGEWTTNNVQATVGLVVRFGPWWGGYRKP